MNLPSLQNLPEIPKLEGKRNICKFLIALFAVLMVSSIGIFIYLNDELDSAKTTVAAKTVVKSLKGYSSSSVDKSELTKVRTERGACVVVMLASGIGIVTCTVILLTDKDETPVRTYVSNPLSQEVIENTRPASSSTSSNKLKELKKLLDDGLITEEEYERKRKEIISKI